MEPAEYGEGRDAFKAFKSRIDNPYPPKTPEHEAWDRGWLSASEGFPG